MLAVQRKGERRVKGEGRRTDGGSGWPNSEEQLLIAAVMVVCGERDGEREEAVVSVFRV